MRSGRIAQLASPDILIENPASPEVAEFLRLGSTADLEWHDDGWRLAGSPHVLSDTARPGQQKARILIPTRAISLAEPTWPSLPATALRSHFRGDGHLVTAAPHGATGIELQVLSPMKIRPGEQIGLSVDSSGILWF